MSHSKTWSNQVTSISLVYSVPNGFSMVEACVFGIFVTCLAIFTVASNAVVIHLTRTSSELKPLGPLCFLLGSMACGDLFMGLIIMPLTGQYSILEEWVYGEVCCMMFVCAEIACGSSTAFHLAAIAIDRYLAIVKPTMYRSLGIGYVLCSISITWTLSLLVMAPTALLNWFGFWKDEDGRYQCEFPQNDMMALLVSSVVLGIPYCIIWSVYIRLYCMNRKRLRDRISKTMKTYQDISRNVNNSNEIDDVVESESETGNQTRTGCVPHLSTVLRKDATVL